MGEIRKFDTGATRDTCEGKLDYEGFYHPLVMEKFAEYMNKNRVQSDGNVRDSDNWQKGIPKDAYMKSCYRHFIDFWKEHRGIKTKDGMVTALCAILFNVQGYLFEYLKDKQELNSVEEKPDVFTESLKAICKITEMHVDGMFSDEEYLELKRRLYDEITL